MAMHNKITLISNILLLIEEFSCANYRLQRLHIIRTLTCMSEPFNLIPTPGFFLSTLFLGPKRDVIGNLLGLSCPLGKSIDPMVTRRFSSMGKLSFEFNTLVISDM